MNQFMLLAIVALHIAFILFVVLTPFMTDYRLMLLHIIIVPFMMAHWYVNDNTCALTLLENQIRSKLYGETPNNNDMFMYRLIAPVYDFKKNNEDLSHVIYVITIILWLLSCFRFYRHVKQKDLKNFSDIILLFGETG